MFFINPNINNWETLSRRITKNKNTDCWEYNGYILPNGYAYISINKKKTYLHRYSYTVHKGKIPKGLLVLHKCDNKICCNPEHLFIGTQQDNMNDMWNKGRGASGEKNNSTKHPELFYGERNPMSKLTEKQVIEIRKLLKSNISIKEISDIYEVCVGSINNIKNKITWKHLKGD